MSLQILGYPRSNFVRTARMAAHEKGVEYELVKAMPQSDEIKAVHPMGQIPALRHGDFELCEAIAIVRYIDAAFDGPALFPANAQACATVNQWCSIVATGVDQLLLRNYVVPYAFHRDADGNVVRDKIDVAIKRFPKMFAMLNTAVADGYVGGDAFNMADCFLMPMLAAVQNFPEGKEALASQPALSDYFGRVSERPSFVATAS